MGEIEQATTEELEAALQARKELGKDYEAALVESFLSKIDQQVAARVDAQVAQHTKDVKKVSRSEENGRIRQFVLGLVSLGTGVPITLFAAGVASGGAIRRVLVPSSSHGAASSASTPRTRGATAPVGGVTEDRAGSEKSPLRNASLLLRIADVRIEPRPYDHADVVSMTAAVQGEYTRLYGDAEGDASPIDRTEFVAPLGWFGVGYLDDRAVAMGGWRRREPGPLIPGTAPAEIKRMYVVPEARGQGLARQILGAIEESAAAAGVDFLILETGLAQPAAIALYRSHGYTEAPPFGFHAAEPEAVHLGKAIESRIKVGER